MCARIKQMLSIDSKNSSKNINGEKKIRISINIYWFKWHKVSYLLLKDNSENLPINRYFLSEVNVVSTHNVTFVDQMVSWLGSEKLKIWVKGEWVWNEIEKVNRQNGQLQKQTQGKIKPNLLFIFKHLDPLSQITQANICSHQKQPFFLHL